MNTETIKVLYQDMKPIMAHRVSIGAFCDKTPDVPVGMTGQILDEAHLLGKGTLEVCIGIVPDLLDF